MHVFAGPQSCHALLYMVFVCMSPSNYLVGTINREYARRVCKVKVLAEQALFPIQFYSLDLIE